MDAGVGGFYQGGSGSSFGGGARADVDVCVVGGEVGSGCQADAGCGAGHDVGTVGKIWEVGGVEGHCAVGRC